MTETIATDAEAPKICSFCRFGAEAEDHCGPLHKAPKLSAHHKCMQYSALLSQYRGFTHFGGFKIRKVEQEIERGKKLKCFHCLKIKRQGGASGATSGCGVRRCSKSFHFYCANKFDPYITRRLLVKNPRDGIQQIHYRVFCSKAHEEKYSEMLRKDMKADTLQVTVQEISEPEDEGETPQPTSQSNSPPNDRTSKPDTGNAAMLTPGGDGLLDTSALDAKAKVATPKQPAVTPVTLTLQAAGDPEPAGSDNETQKPKKRGRKPKHQSTPNLARVVKTEANNNGDLSDSSQASDVPTGKNGRRELGTLETLDPSGAGVKRRASAGPSEAASPVLKKSRNGATPPEELDFNQFKPVIREDSASKQSDCVLALVENFDQLAGQGTDPNVHLSKIAEKEFGVTSSGVYTWQLAQQEHMPTSQMPLFMVDVARSLSQNKMSEVVSMLFHIDQTLLANYKNTVKNFHQYLQSDQKEQLIEGYVKKINDYLDTAEKHFKTKVALTTRSAELGGVVFLLYISNAIDPSGHVRSKLGHKFTMVKWTDDTKLKDVEDFDVDERLMARSGEYNCIQEWLKEKLQDNFKLHILPRENILHANTEESVARKLREHFRTINKHDAESILAFIGPVDNELLANRLYVQKAIRRMLGDKLTDRNDLYVVTDADSINGFTSRSDFIAEDMPADVQLDVWSGLDPTHMAVSCVVVYCKKKTS